MGGTASELANDLWQNAAGNIYLAGGFIGTADFDPDPAMEYLLTSTPTSSGNSSQDAFVLKLLPPAASLAAGTSSTSTLSADWISAVDFVLSEDEATKRKR